LADGRVEVWLEGDREAVVRVTFWCGHGPSWSSVSGIEIHDETPTGTLGFHVG